MKIHRVYCSITEKPACSLLAGLNTAQRKNFYNALKKLIKILPPGTIRSLTGERGKEFVWYQKIENELRISFYFADPYSPWQKGSNENINGLLRENFPKRTNFSTVSQRDLYWKGGVPDKQPAGEGSRVEEGTGMLC